MSYRPSAVSQWDGEATEILKELLQVTILQLELNFLSLPLKTVGGAVTEWLVRWTPDRTVRILALAGALRCVLGQDTLLYSASLHPGV